MYTLGSLFALFLISNPSITFADHTASSDKNQYENLEAQLQVLQLMLADIQALTHASRVASTTKPTHGTKPTKENLTISSIIVANDEMDGGVYAPQQHLKVTVANNEFGTPTLSGKKANYKVTLYDATDGRSKKLKAFSAGTFLIPYANGYSEFEVYLEGGLPFDGEMREKEYKAKIEIDTKRKVKESNERDNAGWSDTWLITHYKG